MKILIFHFLVLTLFTACGAKPVKLLDANWTSMKHPMPPSPKDKLVHVGNIHEEFCVNSWNGSYGLMDEVVKKEIAPDSVRLYERAC